MVLPMFNTLKSLLTFNKPETDQQRVYNWLASSDSLEEIERKQRMLNRGEAPWQVQANNNLKGWI